MEAEDIAKRSDVEPWMVTFAHISMSQMLYLSDMIDEALGYIVKAAELSAAHNLLSLNSLIAITEADIYEKRLDWGMADKTLQNAITQIKYTEPGIGSLVYLDYARLKVKEGKLSDAIDLCHTGLELSVKHQNMEFRRELIKMLADLYYECGDYDESLHYYRFYFSHLENISNQANEMDFNSLLMEYQHSDLRNQIQMGELKLIAANRKIALIGSISVIIVLLFLFLLGLYTTKRKMYDKLALQYHNHIRRTGVLTLTEYAEGNSEEELLEGELLNHEEEDLDKNTLLNDSLHDLFDRIEKIMNSEFYYRGRDISLEKLAEVVGSNRTYTSKAINTYSGLSFTSYINKHRIEDAAKILSSVDNEMLLGEIAEKVGYNSLSVFSKTFQKETGVTPRQFRDSIKRHTV